MTAVNLASDRKASRYTSSRPNWNYIGLRRYRCPCRRKRRRIFKSIPSLRPRGTRARDRSSKHVCCVCWPLMCPRRTWRYSRWGCGKVRDDSHFFSYLSLSHLFSANNLFSIIQIVFSNFSLLFFFPRLNCLWKSILFEISEMNFSKQTFITVSRMLITAFRDPAFPQVRTVNASSHRLRSGERANLCSAAVALFTYGRPLCVSSEGTSQKSKLELIMKTRTV